MRVLSGQTVIDVAMQEAGSAEAAFEIAMQNDLSITDDLVAGTVLVNNAIVNETVVIELAAENIKPASDISIIDINNIIASGEGIGWMQIEYDFIVS